MTPESASNSLSDDLHFDADGLVGGPGPSVPRCQCEAVTQRSSGTATLVSPAVRFIVDLRQ